MLIGLLKMAERGTMTGTKMNELKITTLLCMNQEIVFTW